MTCLAGLLPAPVSGYSPVEVEGISYGEASCSVVGGACSGPGARLIDSSAQGPLLGSSLAAPPWLMSFEISCFATWAGSLTNPCGTLCVCSHVGLARRIMKAGSGFAAL